MKDTRGPLTQRSIYQIQKERREFAKQLDIAGLTLEEYNATTDRVAPTDKDELYLLVRGLRILKIDRLGLMIDDEWIAENLRLKLKDGELFTDDDGYYVVIEPDDEFSEFVEPEDDWFNEVVEPDDYSESESQPEVDSNMKGLMAKMISCVINYPSIVNDPESSGAIEERAKKIPRSDVLMELIHSAQIQPDITKEALIKPYENKTQVYQRLKQLCVMEPFLSENEAKIEFMSTLTAAENHLIQLVSNNQK